MAKRTAQRFIIERDLDPGDLREEHIAEFTDLRWARRFWAAIVWYEIGTRLILRHGGRIMARHPPEQGRELHQDDTGRPL
ncbi:hypothetical protein DYI37_03825 [Fulvimarina endophytica]|uniref:Uncharacterized protein n=1 Tax=Fulvimarina endophytica TaxID=2293836 RepID=A0A371X7G4_9HYPH|nr:hypothetical protein [Fulvimarina endophytica]RFC65004.1 hypothetical protein DYI37_03825 [Fulvimarina endophytica]